MSGGRATVKKFPDPHLKHGSSVVVSKGHVVMLLIGDCHVFVIILSFVLSALQREQTECAFDFTG